MSSRTSSTRRGSYWARSARGAQQGGERQEVDEQGDRREGDRDATGAAVHVVGRGPVGEGELERGRDARAVAAHDRRRRAQDLVVVGDGAGGVAAQRLADRLRRRAPAPVEHRAVARPQPHPEQRLAAAGGAQLAVEVADVAAVQALPRSRQARREARAGEDLRGLGGAVERLVCDLLVHDAPDHERDQRDGEQRDHRDRRHEAAAPAVAQARQHRTYDMAVRIEASLGGLAGAAAGRVAAAAALLVAAAMVLVAAGAGGVLGPLGALVTGERDRSVSTSRSADGDGRARFAPILAAVPRAAGTGGEAVRATSTTPPNSAPARGRDPTARSPRRPPARVPAGSPPPAAAAPAPTASATAQQPPPTAPPPRVVDRVDAVVDDTAAQAPEPVRPALEPAGRITDAVADTCARLPTCP
ncbi:MAG TPA: hypothetical protein VF549_00020 [Solirubrobacteraceae bacterium]